MSLSRALRVLPPPHLSRLRRGRAARPRRPRARRGRPRLLHPPSRAAQPSASPAAPDAARPPCGKTCVFWPRNRVLARRTRPFARRGRSSPAKAQVGRIGRADAPSDRGRSVPELGLLARNRERANMERETCGVRKRRTRGQKPRAREHEGVLGCGMLEAVARGRRRCGRGGATRRYRQESCALFRQPHKPAVRCGYPSSRVTSR